MKKDIVAKRNEKIAKNLKELMKKSKRKKVKQTSNQTKKQNVGN